MLAPHVIGRVTGQDLREDLATSPSDTHIRGQSVLEGMATRRCGLTSVATNDGRLNINTPGH